MLYRYAIGRYKLDAHDEALVEHLVAGAGSGGVELAALITDLVGSESFRYRREEDGK